jgi:hypothetical protein
MLLETMVDRGLGLIVVGAESLSIFCTFKKSAQNQDQNENEKKRPGSPLFLILLHLYSLSFVVVVICSRCHL